MRPVSAWVWELAPDMSDATRAPLRIGLTQWHATDEPLANLVKAENAVARSAAQGAQIVVLPENGLMLSTGPKMRDEAIDASGEAVARLAEAARQNNVAVIMGGTKFRHEGRISNRALVFDRTGAIVGSYDKIHLFDARVTGHSFEASKVEESGSEPVIVEFGGWKLGLTICYDVRFPELYRHLALSGAEVLLVPSAFTRITGRAHWETLLRARAIENGCYVVAPATVTPPGVEGDAFETFGHALVVDPWGAILEDLGEQDASVAVATLEFDEVAKARHTLPVLEQVRVDAYRREVRYVHVVDGGKK